MSWCVNIKADDLHVTGGRPDYGNETLAYGESKKKEKKIGAINFLFRFFSLDSKIDVQPPK